MWCKLRGAIYAVQSMCCSPRGAPYVAQSAWASVCGAMYVGGDKAARGPTPELLCDRNVTGSFCKSAKFWVSEAPVDPPRAQGSKMRRVRALAPRGGGGRREALGVVFWEHQEHKVAHSWLRTLKMWPGNGVLGTRRAQSGLQLDPDIPNVAWEWCSGNTKSRKWPTVCSGHSKYGLGMVFWQDAS